MKRLAILAVLVAAVGCRSRDPNGERGVTQTASPDTSGTYTSTNPSTEPAPSTEPSPSTTTPSTGTADTTTGTASGTTGTPAGGTYPSTTGANTGSTATSGEDTRDTGGTAGGQAMPSTTTMGGAAKGGERSSVSFAKSADSDIEGTLDILQGDDGLVVSGNFASAPKDRSLELVIVADCAGTAQGEAIGTLAVQTDGSVTFDGSADKGAMEGKSLAVREQGSTKPLACAAITRM